MERAQVMGSNGHQQPSFAAAGNRPLLSCSCLSSPLFPRTFATTAERLTSRSRASTQDFADSESADGVERTLALESKALELWSGFPADSLQNQKQVSGPQVPYLQPRPHPPSEFSSLHKPAPLSSAGMHFPFQALRAWNLR